MDNKLIFKICWLVFILGACLIGCDNNNKKNMNSPIKIEWCRIPGGDFLMGRSKGERLHWEGPAHLVYLDEFFISKYETTDNQFEVFCKATGRQKPNRDHVESKEYPVVDISWLDAMAFCKWLSQMTGEHISLPTEAQWEKSARGGTTGDNYVYQSEDMPVAGFSGHPIELLELYEWFAFNSNEDYHPVGKLKPNPFGIHDILGNVSERCFDLFDENYYKVSPRKNPQGPAKNENGFRVIRGGNYSTDYKPLRCSYRRGSYPDTKGCIGFRIVKNLN